MLCSSDSSNERVNPHFISFGSKSLLSGALVYNSGAEYIYLTVTPPSLIIMCVPLNSISGSLNRLSVFSNSGIENMTNSSGKLSSSTAFDAIVFAPFRARRTLPSRTKILGDSVLKYFNTSIVFCEIFYLKRAFVVI